MVARSQFNEDVYECLSWDAKSLFTSINVPRTIKYVCDIIYSDEEKYFPKIFDSSVAEDVLLPFPPRLIFEQMFIDCLTKFSSFSTLDGFYKQTEGLSMGSRLSPALANIFCHMMEENVISGYCGNKILFYVRYVDDIFVIIKKGFSTEILNEMNTFDSFLSFVPQQMVNNSLIFLDTKIYIDGEGTLQLGKYSKPSASDVILNFSKSVTPHKYKISTLCGEIHRCNHTTTTLAERDKALAELKTKFLNNKYPAKMINNKIAEIKNRDFVPSEFRSLREKDAKENPGMHANISLPFTSYRCDKIAQK